MYVCKPGLLLRLISWVVMLAMLPEVFFCFYMLTKCPAEERTFYLGGGIIFGAVFLMLLFRLVLRGISWLEYDDEKVVFHLSRDDEQTVPWADLPSELVRVERALGVIGFTFLPGEEYDKKAFMNVSFGFSGYRDFKRECYRREVLLPPFKMSTDEQKAATEILEQMLKHTDAEVLEDMLNQAEQQGGAENKPKRWGGNIKRR